MQQASAKPFDWNANSRLPLAADCGRKKGAKANLLKRYSFCIFLCKYVWITAKKTCLPLPKNSYTPHLLLPVLRLHEVETSWIVASGFRFGQAGTRLQKHDFRNLCSKNKKRILMSQKYTMAATSIAAMQKKQFRRKCRNTFFQALSFCPFALCSKAAPLHFEPKVILPSPQLFAKATGPPRLQRRWVSVTLKLAPFTEA